MWADLLGSPRWWASIATSGVLLRSRRAPSGTIGVMTRSAIAVDVYLALTDGTDARAPGGAVTVALCGHWEHDGPCRWPHNSRINAGSHPVRLRIVLVVPDDERAEALGRVEAGLRGDSRWCVRSFGLSVISADEEDLAKRLFRAT